MNGQYIRTLPVQYISDLCKPYFMKAGIDISDNDKYLKVINTARNYISVLPEIITQSDIYYTETKIDSDERSHLITDSAKLLFNWYINELNNITNFTKDSLTELVNRGMTETGLKGKQYYHPLRLALINKGSGPDIPTLIDIFGRDETINKLRQALSLKLG